MTNITIRRPNGDIEVVAKAATFGPAIQAKMIEATRAAGRGEILSFELIVTDEDRAIAAAEDAKIDRQLAVEADYRARERRYACGELG